MTKLRKFAALSELLNRITFTLGAGFIFILLSISTAHADEPTNPSDPSTPTSNLPSQDPSQGSGSSSSTSSSNAGSSGSSEPNPQSDPLENQISTTTQPLTSTSVQTKIEEATLSLSTAITEASPEQQSAASSEVIEARAAINAAEDALIDAVAAENAVNEQLVVVAEAETAVDEAQDALNQADAAVEAQEAIVTQENNELTEIQNTPLGSMVYTTAGYEAPVAPENPTVVTTVLPQMGDASTKITVPFDIKMGDTVFEGQGSASQIYVSSKAIISFGGPDYTYWGWPNMTQDGIYVFNSDFTSFGTGAGITVTTTETTLSIDWNVHKWGDLNGPLTNISWDMTVNPQTGEWTGTGSMSGSTVVWNGPNTGVRQDNVLTQIPTYTQASKDAAILAQQAVVTTQNEILSNLTEVQSEAEEALELAQTTLEIENLTLSTLLSSKEETITIADQLADSALQFVLGAVSALEAPLTPPTNGGGSDQGETQNPGDMPGLDAPGGDIPSDNQGGQETPQEDSQASTDQPTDSSTDPSTGESGDSTDQSGSEGDNGQTDEGTSDSGGQGNESEGTDTQPESPNQEQENQSTESPSDTTTTEEAVNQLLEEANGEPISAEALEEAGLSYSDLPPETPVEVRTDENGNPVIINAEVAAALVLLENPAELLGTLFDDPGQALAALGNIGADMSPEEREEATKMVVATVIATGAALNAVGLATGGSSPSAPSGGGGGSGGGPSGENKAVRRRRESN